jgi:hypothetical protein
MGKGNSHARGNSFANGNVLPPWARGWQFSELRASQVTIWDFH